MNFLLTNFIFLYFCKICWIIVFYKRFWMCFTEMKKFIKKKKILIALKATLLIFTNRSRYSDPLTPQWQETVTTSLHARYMAWHRLYIIAFRNSCNWNVFFITKATYLMEFDNCQVVMSRRLRTNIVYNKSKFLQLVTCKYFYWKKKSYLIVFCIHIASDLWCYIFLFLCMNPT